MHFKPFQKCYRLSKSDAVTKEIKFFAKCEQPGQMSSLSFTPTTDIHASQVETVNLSPSFHQIIATI